MDTQTQAQHLAVSLGAAPLDPKMPGEDNLEWLFKLIGKMRQMPEYQEVVAQRRAGKLSKEQMLERVNGFLRQLKAQEEADHE